MWSRVTHNPAQVPFGNGPPSEESGTHPLQVSVQLLGTLQLSYFKSNPSQLTHPENLVCVHNTQSIPHAANVAASMSS